MRIKVSYDVLNVYAESLLIVLVCPIDSDCTKVLVALLRGTMRKKYLRQNCYKSTAQKILKMSWQTAISKTGKQNKEFTPAVAIFNDIMPNIN